MGGDLPRLRVTKDAVPRTPQGRRLRSVRLRFRPRADSALDVQWQSGRTRRGVREGVAPTDRPSQMGAAPLGALMSATASYRLQPASSLLPPGPTTYSAFMDSAAFSALAASRRSTRDFLPDPVPHDVLDEILADATTAPSWSNTRPYMLALATGERADRLRTAYVAAWEKSAPLHG